ncbi:MAG: Uma2 family endonuclease [Gemmataceae bacterium]
MPGTIAERRADYDRTADEYLKGLPLEHFMEATPQATQRGIFMVAFDMIARRRPDVHPYSELLVQYEHGDPPVRRYVVPDNMVVLHAGEIDAVKSYPVSLQPARPLLVLEYVSKESERKDYEDSFRKYEQELKVPYYLLGYPDNEEMTLFALRGAKYQAVVPDDAGRVAIPELEVQAGLINEYVRFWFRGELLPRGYDIPDILDRKDQQITERDQQISERDQRLSERDQQLSERDQQLSERERQIRERDRAIEQLRQQLADALRARDGHP